MPRPKSLDGDREICRDLEILSFLDSSSREVSGFLHISCPDFSIRRDFIFILKMSRFLDKSWFVLTISTILTKILTRQSLDWKVLILKISTKTKKSLSRQSRNSWQVLKVCLDRSDREISILIGLDCQDPQAYKYILKNGQANTPFDANET